MILFLLPVARDDFKNKDDNQNYKKMHLHFVLITRIRNSSRARSKKICACSVELDGLCDATRPTKRICSNIPNVTLVIQQAGRNIEGETGG